MLLVLVFRQPANENETFRKAVQVMLFTLLETVLLIYGKMKMCVCVGGGGEELQVITKNKVNEKVD